jgi:hypothetical protein
MRGDRSGAAWGSPRSTAPAAAASAVSGRVVRRDISSAAAAASTTAAIAPNPTTCKIASRACHAAVWVAGGKPMTTVPTVLPSTTTGT